MNYETYDEPFGGRYEDVSSADELEVSSLYEQPDDAAMTRLMVDLEQLYTSDAPAPALAEQFEALLQARTTQKSAAVSMPEQTAESTPSGSRAARWPATLLHIPARPAAATNAASQGASTMTRKRLSTIAACAAALLVVALMGALLYSIRAGSTNLGSGGGSFEQRLQQQGGIRVVFVAGCSHADGPCQPISADIPVIEHRIEGLVSQNNRLLFVNGAGQLVVEVISPVNEHQLQALLGQTGELDILDTGPLGLVVGTDVTGQTCTTSCSAGQYKIVFTGAELDPNAVSASLDPQTNQPVVQFAFKGAARSAFATYTKNNIANYLTITLDNKVIESATIQSEITGVGEISGGHMSLNDAKILANLLKAGALPLPILVINYIKVNPGTPLPTLPNDSCQPTPTPTPMPPSITPTVTPYSGTDSTPTATIGGATPTAAPTNGTGCPTPTVTPPATPTPSAGPVDTPPVPPLTPTPPPTPTPTPRP